jgi:hypothetical protein
MACDASDYAVGVRGHVRLFANTRRRPSLPDDLASFTCQRTCTDWKKHSANRLFAVENGRADIGILPITCQLNDKPPYRDD